MEPVELEAKIAATPGEKVTEAYIKSRIAQIDYLILPDTTVTICSITLDNGFSVRGESACVDPQNFRQDISESIAYDNAFRQLWPLFGFLLAERRHQPKPLGGLQFRKKPVVIEAYQWTGGQDQLNDPVWIVEALKKDRNEPGAVWIEWPSTADAAYKGETPALYIHTLEGNHRADLNDWIIRGVKGELYPCKPDIFSATYDAVV